eukprot:SAG31_NODE_1215_length_9335_cov_5.846470_6_plen_81_part_00
MPGVGKPLLEGGPGGTIWSERVNVCPLLQQKVFRASSRHAQKESWGHTLNFHEKKGALAYSSDARTVKLWRRVVEYGPEK